MFSDVMQYCSNQKVYILNKPNTLQQCKWMNEVKKYETYTVGF